MRQFRWQALGKLIVFLTLCNTVVGQENASVNILSAEGFARYFKADSIAVSKIKNESLLLVQTGYISLDGTGEMLRYKQLEKGSADVSYRKRMSNGKIESLQWLIDEKNILVKVQGLINAYPTKPLMVDEAIAILHQTGGRNWLFEYRDPLGGIVSMITAENLPELQKKRDHDAFRKQFEIVVKEIQSSQK